MTTDLIKPLLECIKLAPRYAIISGTLCLILLILPEQALQWLDIVDIAQKNRPILGMALVISAAFCLPQAILFISNRLRKLYFRHYTKKRLHGLTEKEKEILRYYIIGQTRTNLLDIGDGIVQGLAMAGVIFQSSDLSRGLAIFPYNITEFAWKYLNKKQILLDGKTTRIRNDWDALPHLFP